MTAALAPAELVRLRDDLRNGSMVKAAHAADVLARQADAPPEWRYTLCDKWWRPVMDLGPDIIDNQGVDPRNDKPVSAFKVKGGTSDAVDHFATCRETLVGVKVEIGAYKQAFYVDTHDYELQTSDGPAYVSTANCFGIWDILNYLIILPTWFLPVQAQPISHAILFGGLVTVLENVIAESAMRVQLGINEFLNNALSLNPDMRAWIGSILQSRGDITQMLKTPIYVVRTDPSLDTSPRVVRVVRMETCGAVIKDVTAPYGVVVDVDLWEPGDPQPDSWADLRVPTYVVRVRDRSQIEGPFKNVLDGVLRTVVDVGGSLGSVFEPLIQQASGMSGVFVSPSLGVNFTPPIAMFVAPEQGEKGSAITGLKITDHTPKAWELMIGGKSPKWLTDLQNAFFSWILDSVMILIGFTGVPSTLLDGFLADAWFAFAVLEHYTRRDQMGPMHPNITMFKPTQASPYNVDGAAEFINFLWETKGYTSAQVTVRGSEYEYGKDIFRGGLAQLVYRKRTRMLSDYVEAVTWHLSENTRDFLYQIGDGKAEEPPLAKHQRDLTGLQELINVITLAPQS